MSDNVENSDAGTNPTEPPATPQKKKKPDDPSLSLQRGPTVNRKLLRVGATAIGLAVMLGLGFGLQPSKPKTTQQKADQGPQQYNKQVPTDLTVTPNDYMPLYAQQPPSGSQPRGMSAVGSQNTGLPEYSAYARTPPSDQQAQYPGSNPAPGSTPQPGYAPQNAQAQNQPPAPQPTSQNPLAIFGGTPQDDEARKKAAALTSGFFFPWISAEQQAEAAKAKAAALAQQTPGASADAAAIASAYESAYSKQNMAQEKNLFLANQQADYSAYLDNHYLTPLDSTHLLQATTLIPLTLQTAINSDLPGTVTALVDENVFDSLTGRNILIPRGSKLIGTYDNSIAFGQNRVLVTWQRLIRADGISISLRGMKGVDLQGNPGMHDQVDYHWQNVLAVVGASTAFTIATDAAVSAMSTNKFLSSLATAMTAQGSTSSNVTSAANAAATTYADKIINQQPTVIIREGTRGYCLIDKDMVLPIYVDADSGYMGRQQ